MKAAFTACILAAVAIAAEAAPALTEGGQDITVGDVSSQSQRDKRSHYGGGGYYSPCAAASLPVPVVAPSTYQLNLAPVHGAGYGLPHASYGGYGGGAHYRSDVGDEQEMMNFSDLDQFNTIEHSPMARYGAGHDALPLASHYGGGGGGGAGFATGGGIGAYGHYGPAYGYFPHANTGGCNVPLLLSCSPSVVSGKLIHSHNYGGYSGGAGYSGGGLGGGISIAPASSIALAGAGDGGYREVEVSQPHQEVHKESVEEQVSPQKNNPSHEISHVSNVHS